MSNQYFPLGLAKGSAFCNRISERKQLNNNIQSGRHTLIISPRRYGKSSLALYVLDTSKLPYTRVDLFIASDEKKIEQAIITGVKSLFNQVASKHEKILQIIKKYIKQYKLKFIIGTDGINFELIATDSTDVASNIKSALLLAEHILENKKTPAVFFIDECQEIGEIAANKGIEGAIRHVAQETQYLRFIFSGSYRHLLSQMFDDRSRPLYKLCDRMNINRIHQQDYIKFIQKIAIIKWKKELPESILIKIFELTERHPYYFNALCGRILDHYPKNKPTDTKKIEDLWVNYCNEEKVVIAKELSLLSPIQQKLMIYIALGNHYTLSGKKAIQTLNTTSAAIIKALKLLEEKDYVYRMEDQAIHLVDPLIKMTIIINHSSTPN